MTETMTRTSQGANENVMALVAYILTWITGLIILLISPKGAKYQRWHAIQSIGLGIAWTLVMIVGNVMGVGLFAMGRTSAGGSVIVGLIFTLLGLGFVVLWIIMMVTSYQGKKIRLPIIAGIADKNA